MQTNLLTKEFLLLGACVLVVCSACEHNAASNHASIAELSARNGEAFDLYTVYSSPTPGGLTVAFDERSGLELTGGCSVTVQNQVKQSRCNWVYGPNQRLYLVANRAFGQGAMVFEYRVEQSGRRLVLAEMGDFHSDGSTLRWEQHERDSYWFGRGTSPWGATAYMEVLVATADDKLEDQLSRGAEGATPVEPSPEPGSNPGSVEERLKKLDELKEKGLVTEDEYQAKRQEILESL